MPQNLIDTDRLVLRPPELGDASVMFESYASDAEATRYLLMKTSVSVSETEDFIRNSLERWEEDTCYSWLITGRSDGTVLGGISLRRQDAGAEVGYVLRRQDWGKGYMTEALAAVVDLGLSQTDIFRVWATTNTENLASIRVWKRSECAVKGLCASGWCFPTLVVNPGTCICMLRSNNKLRRGSRLI